MIRTLSCHCGQVRLEVNAELDRLIARTGADYLSINARCLDDVDIFTLEVVRYDGRTDMPGGDVPPLADSRAGALSSS